MGLYKNNNGVLIPIAGRGKAEYGASTTRRNTWTNSEAINPDSSIAFSVSFDVPMPDDNYEIDWTCSASALHPVVEEKTASGFTGHAYRLISPAVEIGNGIINFTAFRLYTDLEYNEVLEDTSALIKNTAEMGAVNLFETTLHTQRYNKVIYTVNSDGTIDIEILERPSGSTGNVIGWIDVKAGETYKLTGGISETERLELRNADYSSWTDNTVGKAVSSPIVETNVDTFMPNDDATLMVYCRIDESGNTGNVGTLEPMIRFASFSDDTFLPYAKTNRLLTVETDELFANAAMLKGMTAISSQTDLNDVTTIGNYYKSSTSIYVTNAPTGIDSETSAIFRLNVENGSDSTDKYIQTIIKNDGTTYKRGYDGTNWSSWIEFASSVTVSGINTRLTTAETDIDNLESSRLKTYTSDATAWDTEPTASSTKPVTSGGVKTQLDSINTEIADMNDILGAKNLLPVTMVSQVLSGITFTVDSTNGIIGVSGNNSGVPFSNILGTTELSPGTYKVTTGQTTELNAQVGIAVTNASSGAIIARSWNGTEVFTISSDTQVYFHIEINVAGAITTTTIYPACKPASIKDNTYVPYAMTNRQLTSQISNLPFNKLLWEGSFSSGSITVTNAAKYSIFVMKSGTIACIGTASYGIGGFLGADTYNVGLCGYRLTPTVSGNNIIFKIDSSAKGGAIDGAAAAITAIYGVC